MKERPILFSCAMVRAILAGTKTQTRRLAKQVKHPDLGNLYTPGALVLEGEPQHVIHRACPFGQVGDRLWVREAWRIGAWDEDNAAVAVDYCDGSDKQWRNTPRTPEGLEFFNRLWIQSSNEMRVKGIKPDADGNYRFEPGQSPLRWRPSIHMPRIFSRITLEITDVRMERLRAISEADAKAEGAHFELARLDSVRLGAKSSYLSGFSNLWQSINGFDSWHANPWVWVITFRRVEVDRG